MKNYRLKKEAVQFMNVKYATSIYPLDTWHNQGVDINALEEVGDPYLSFGHKTGENSSTLSGWDKEGSHFNFVVHFPSTKFYEHDKFANGRIVRDMMNKIQYQIDNFYTQFSTGEKEE